MGIKKSWKKREEDRQQRKNLVEKVRQRKADFGEKLKKERIKQQKKEERRKYNEMKSGTYQVIRNTAKLKKWNKKAKKSLTKLPAELFYEKFGSKS